MDKDGRLLAYSLCQVENMDGFKEKKCWKEGVRSLAELAEATAAAERSERDALAFVEALEREDWGFFLSAMHPADYYRVAYSAPDEVMFLDVETTGLSPARNYMTMAGWLRNGRYGYWLQGTDPSKFLEEFAASPLVVTFNGIAFDSRFLDTTFHTRDFSTKPNLDLMHMARRHGLTGGQKRIEDLVGFRRPPMVQGADGRDAVRSWRRFLGGSDDGLRKLLVYNRCDMYGMAAILDHLFFEKIYGTSFPQVGSPRRFLDQQAALREEIDLPDEGIRERIRRTVEA